MSFLDTILAGIKTIASNGVPLPAQPTVDFTGATVTNDPTNGVTHVAIDAAIQTAPLDASTGINVGDVVGASPTLGKFRKATNSILGSMIATSAAPAGGTPSGILINPIVAPSVTGLSGGVGDVIRDPTTGTLTRIPLGSATSSDDYVGELNADNVLTMRPRIVDRPAIAVSAGRFGALSKAGFDNITALRAAIAGALLIAAHLGTKTVSAAVDLDGGAYEISDTLALAVNDAPNGYQTGVTLRGAYRPGTSGTGNATTLVWTSAATASGVTASVNSDANITSLTGASLAWVGQSLTFTDLADPNLGSWPVTQYVGTGHVQVKTDRLTTHSSTTWVVAKPMISIQSRDCSVEGINFTVASGATAACAVQSTQVPFRGTISGPFVKSNGGDPTITITGVPQMIVTGLDLAQPTWGTLVVKITTTGDLSAGAGAFEYSLDNGSTWSTAITPIAGSYYLGLSDTYPGWWTNFYGSGLTLTFAAGTYTINHTYTIGTGHNDGLTSNLPKPNTNNAIRSCIIDNAGGSGVFCNGVVLADLIGVQDGNTQDAANCDFFQIIDCRITRVAHACVWIPNASGQCKLHNFFRSHLVTSPYAIRMRTGSFRAYSCDFSANARAVSAVQCTDTIEMYSCSSEELSLLLVSESEQSASWPVIMIGGRHDTSNLHANKARDGLTVNGTFISWAFAPLTLKHINFGASYLADFAIEHDSSNIPMNGSFEGCSFPNMTPLEHTSINPAAHLFTNCFGLDSGGVVHQIQNGWIEHHPAKVVTPLGYACAPTQAAGALGTVTLSSSAVLRARNLNGTTRIGGASTTTKSVVFDTPEDDPTYALALSVGTAYGTPAAGALRASYANKSTAGFDVAIEAAAGIAAAVDVQWVLSQGLWVPQRDSRYTMLWTSESGLDTGAKTWTDQIAGVVFATTAGGPALDIVNTLNGMPAVGVAGTRMTFTRAISKNCTIFWIAKVSSHTGDQILWEDLGFVRGVYNKSGTTAWQKYNTPTENSLVSSDSSAYQLCAIAVDGTDGWSYVNATSPSHMGAGFWTTDFTGIQLAAEPSTALPMIGDIVAFGICDGVRLLDADVAQLYAWAKRAYAL